MIIKHFLSYFFAQGIPAILAFVSMSIYSRLITPEEYGIYAMVLATSGLINSILFEWLRMGLLRFYPSKTSEMEKKELLGTVLTAFLILLFITAVLTTIIYGTSIFSETGNDLWVYVILLTWLQAWLSMNLTFFRSNLLRKSYSIVSVMRAVATFIISLVLVYMGMKYESLILGMILGIIVSVVVPTIRFWKIKYINLFNKKLMYELLKYGLPFTFTFAMGAIINSTDRFFLNWLKDSSATGLYSIAYDFSSQTIMNLMMIVNLAAYPLALRAFEREGEEACKRQLNKNAILLFLITIPAMAGIFTLSENISNVFFGEEYRSVATQVIPWISLAAFLNGSTVYYVNISFQLGKKTKYQVIPVCIAAIVNIILNYIFIPKYGVMGAVYSTLVAYIIALVISYILAKNIFYLPIPWREIWKIIFSTFIMVIIIKEIAHFQGIRGLVFQVFVGTTAYLICIIFMNISDVRTKIFKKIRT
ncbi:polysaccharide biosynthesis protein [Bacillus sp. UMTAT18]|uniref:lipopolysaccharide biosynthesis protein n=1 Tax=Bacillus TaxID=1386 RepID=UPI00061867BF|nr:MULTISPECIES: oligosaccharide flippase family protein [unclassified Bacillus (in: firmicutes)]KKC55756.1 polysaccharide biosynthesis protein [Bacillus sp. UMTAT18]OJD78438.1 hypothetical protein BAU29_16365 [Bacillus sp. P14-1]